MGLFSSIFGGSKNKSKSTSTSSSSSSNRAYDFLQGAYAPTVGVGNQATNAISALLGLGGNPAQFQQGFNNYKQSTGYDFMMDSGSRAITGNAASRGLLNSGSTLKGLTQFGQNTGSQYFNNYLTQLLGLTQNGLTAGSLLGSAGQTSQSTGVSTGTSNGKSSNGIGGFLGGILGL